MVMLLGIRWAFPIEWPFLSTVLTFSHSVDNGTVAGIVGVVWIGTGPYDAAIPRVEGHVLQAFGTAMRAF